MNEQQRRGIVAARGRGVKKDDGESGENNRHSSPVFCWGPENWGTALRTHAMNAFEFGDKSFANAIRVTITGGDAADIRSVDVEFASYPSVNPAMQKVPGKQCLSVGLTVG